MAGINRNKQSMDRFIENIQQKIDSNIKVQKIRMKGYHHNTSREIDQNKEQIEKYESIYLKRMKRFEMKLNRNDNKDYNILDIEKY